MPAHAECPEVCDMLGGIVSPVVPSVARRLRPAAAVIVSTASRSASLGCQEFNDKPVAVFEQQMSHVAEQRRLPLDLR
jgi:hypothetical protein